MNTSHSNILDLNQCREYSDPRNWWVGSTYEELQKLHIELTPLPNLMPSNGLNNNVQILKAYLNEMLQKCDHIEEVLSLVREDSNIFIE